MGMIKIMTMEAENRFWWEFQKDSHNDIIMLNNLIIMVPFTYIVIKRPLLLFLENRSSHFQTQSVTIALEVRRNSVLSASCTSFSFCLYVLSLSPSFSRRERNGCYP